MHLDQIWVERDRLLVGADCLVELSRSAKCLGKIDVVDRYIWFNLDRPLNKLDRSLMVSRL